jgi:hypothetical protein
MDMDWPRACFDVAWSAGSALTARSGQDLFEQVSIAGFAVAPREFGAAARNAGFDAEDVLAKLDWCFARQVE